jgi:hypothetical protein
MPQATEAQLPARGSIETFNVTFDFSNALSEGETISAVASVTINAFKGIDPDAQSRLYGSATISGSLIGIRLREMLADVTYQIIVAVQTTDSETLGLWVYQPIEQY